MSYRFNTDLMTDTMINALKYLPVTLSLSFISLVLALIIASILSFKEYLGDKKGFYIGRVFSIYSKSIPVILTLLTFNHAVYGIAGYLSEVVGLNINIKKIDPLWIGILALSINGIGYLVETMRSALKSVGKGQLEAGYSVGMTTFQTIREIILPQIMIEALPNLKNNVTATIKLSSIAFSIAIIEVLNSALIYTATTYAYIEAYVGCAVIYWILNELITGGIGLLERYLRIKNKATA